MRMMQQRAQSGALQHAATSLLARNSRLRSWKQHAVALKPRKQAHGASSQRWMARWLRHLHLPPPLLLILWPPLLSLAALAPQRRGLSLVLQRHPWLYRSKLLHSTTARRLRRLHCTLMVGRSAVCLRARHIPHHNTQQCLHVPCRHHSPLAFIFRPLPTFVHI